MAGLPGDLDRSAAATRAYREGLQADAEQRAARAEDAAAAADERARRHQKLVEQRGRRKTRGTMNTAPEVAVEPVAEVAPGRSAAASGAGAPKRPTRASQDARREANELLGRRRRLAAEYGALLKNLNENPMADHAGGSVQLDALRREIADIDARLDELGEVARER